MRFILPAVLALFWTFSLNAQPMLGRKPLGVLLLSKTGGHEWDKTVQDIRKELGREAVVEDFSGSPDSRVLQRALDKLSSARVERIVAVPVYLHSGDEELEQIRYLLGLQKFPCASFSLAAHANRGSSRVRRALPQGRLALAMTGAVDDDPAVDAALLARAKELGRRSEREALLVAVPAPLDEARRSAWLDSALKHAQNVREKGRYRSAHAILLAGPAPDMDAAPDLRRRFVQSKEPMSAEKELQETVRSLSRSASVMILPYILIPDGTDRSLQKSTEGSFCKISAKGLLPSPDINAWIRARIQEGLRLPDMIAHRDEGQLPAARVK
ncbi:MAG: hypothetical protein WCU88_01630 [Elusimicrobiota bacterium]|jgi:sirohydrochlorin ferrochelatase